MGCLCRRGAHRKWSNGPRQGDREISYSTWKGGRVPRGKEKKKKVQSTKQSKPMGPSTGSLASFTT